MPPKQATNADDDDDNKVDPESLDKRHRKNASGGNLVTLHGDVEEELPQATELDRVR